MSDIIESALQARFLEDVQAVFVDNEGKPTEHDGAYRPCKCSRSKSPFSRLVFVTRMHQLTPDTPTARQRLSALSPSIWIGGFLNFFFRGGILCGSRGSTA